MPYNLLDALEEAGLFELVGDSQTGGKVWTPTVEKDIACWHSQNGFSQERMGKENVADFDVAICERIKNR